MKTRIPLISKGLRYRLWAIILIAVFFLIFSSFTKFLPNMWEKIGFNSEDKAILTVGMLVVLLISLSGLLMIERSPSFRSSSNPAPKEKEEEDDPPPKITTDSFVYSRGKETDHISKYYNTMLLELQKKLAQVNQYAKSLADANESLTRVAAKDGLSGLYNQSFIKERLQQELYRTERYHHSFSLLMIDLDDFKALNDRFGHVVGDRVLKTVARLMVEVIRPSDIPARYGGEEFLIILPETTTENAERVGERIRQRVESYPFEGDSSGNNTFQITVSVGICTYPDFGRTAEELINHADAALYGAKRTGKNRLVIYKG